MGFIRNPYSCFPRYMVAAPIRARGKSFRLPVITKFIIASPILKIINYFVRVVIRNS